MGRDYRTQGTIWRRAAAAVAATVALPLLAACGGSGTSATAKPVPPQTLLRRSRNVVDATSAVHFVLSSTHVSGSAIELTGGSGDLVRPDELKGSFTVTTGGLDAAVGVVEVGGKLYAEPPFASHYSVTNPATYGLGDPAQLLDPRTGVSALLTSMTDVRTQGEHRLAGELVEQISGMIPGREVPVLPDLRPSTPVTLTVSIDPATFQLREVTLAGPFTSASSTTTYTVTLSAYGEHVHVVAPAT
jgi:lipoprotein LprG